MKAIMSLWTLPMGGDLNERWKSNWLSTEAHLCGWVKAFFHTKMFFDEVELITDSIGADILCEKIGIPFDKISTSLDDMNLYPKGVWAAGKIKAYAEQDVPFFHIDADCFLYKPLPEEWLHSPIAAQNIEDADWFKGSYLPEVTHAEKTLRFFPKTWGNAQWAPCLGVFAASDLDYVKQYTDEAIDFLCNPNNKSGWDRISNQGSYSIIAEQYMAACVAEERKAKITWLCPDGTIDKDYLENIGYCHLWGAKKEQEVHDKLIQVTRRDYTKYYNNISRMTK